MRDTLTISLPGSLRRVVTRSAKKQNVTTSEFIRDALQHKLWIDAFDETRGAAVPKARARGVYTDEDVFKIIS